MGDGLFSWQGLLLTLKQGCEMSDRTTQQELQMRFGTQQHYERFVAYATEKHGNQKRKDGSPYINHPIRVGEVALEIGKELTNALNFSWGIEKSLATLRLAGVGHDLLEDTATDWDNIRYHTSSLVADIVAIVSDDKRLPTDARHREYIARLKNAVGPDGSPSGLYPHIIKLADLYDNSGDSIAIAEIRPKGLRRWHHRASDCFGVLDNRLSLSMFWQATKDRLAALDQKLTELGWPDLSSNAPAGIGAEPGEE
jgi:(p)ppGpp synthase/HD superfamily hydrolase